MGCGFGLDLLPDAGGECFGESRLVDGPLQRLVEGLRFFPQ